MIEDIKKLVKEECQKETNIYGMSAYRHFVAVVKYAKQLANKRKADEEIVEIAAWLHDIGSIKGNTENHHIVGAEFAGELLKKYNYPKNKIEAVQHCIMSRRGSQNIKRETLEAECLADADAMSHFDSIDALFRIALVDKKLNQEESRDFVFNKLTRSWNKLSPYSQKLFKSKYEAVKELLGDENKS